MEIFILIAIVLALWTNEILLGNKLLQEKPGPTAEEKFAEAVKTYLKEGINIRSKD
ncbi:hypothetical protein [Pseudanabaena sp. FACHB-2040]|uniref:hypothetical protein n=1 Tax=Pseudanabaena sp. FACHB-2040 TaxID=2692859 RepID=UPI0016885E4E|nr:hypothetical protein [Pseudanabaena sp. FACHB-2040]MBD2256143.1 hypothetical protein [Pseudanabaena sp. FACHB-2040]